MRRVVITGAASMLGAALVKECIKNNVEVLAVVRRGTARQERLPKSRYIEVMECSLEQLASIEKGNKIYDVFYHFAWAHTSKETRDDPLLQERNIRYTLDAVELAGRLGCRKFVGAGSQAEYGPKEGVVTPETEINPQTSYGMAKYAAGTLSRKLCARFSSAVQMWDYLYEDDAGKIFYLLGECIEEDKVYCIASGESRPLKEFILEMRQTFGKGAECEFAPKDSQPSAGLQPDVSGLFRDISYRPAKV